MLTKTIKWTAIAALIGEEFLRSASPYRLVTQSVVATAAVVVRAQAASMRRYIWTALFLMVVCLFNPAYPVPLSNYISSLVTALAALLFFFSLELLQPEPLNVSSQRFLRKDQSLLVSWKRE